MKFDKYLSYIEPNFEGTTRNDLEQRYNNLQYNFEETDAKSCRFKKKKMQMDLPKVLQKLQAQLGKFLQ